MERSPLPSLERSAHLVPMTPVRRRLAEEILRISLTELPQAAIRELGPTSSSAPSDQPGVQEPGSLADQARLQNERDGHLQIAYRSLRAVSIVSHDPEYAAGGQDGYQAFADAAHDAWEDFNRGRSRQIESSTGMQNLHGNTLFPCRDPRDRLNLQMWARFRLELLRLEIGLAAEFSDSVNVWVCEIMRSWWDRQPPGKQQS